MHRGGQSRFQRKVEEIAPLRAFYRRGLQALSESERNQIACENPRQLTGSICLDVALRNTCPQEARWDYGIGYRHRDRIERVTWIEFHAASSDHVGAVLRKFVWLRQWLENHAQSLKQMTNGYYWLATGQVAITPTSRQAKRLAQAGLRGPFKRLTLR